MLRTQVIPDIRRAIECYRVAGHLEWELHAKLLLADVSHLIGDTRCAAETATEVLPVAEAYQFDAMVSKARAHIDGDPIYQQLRGSTSTADRKTAIFGRRNIPMNTFSPAQGRVGSDRLSRRCPSCLHPRHHFVARRCARAATLVQAHSTAGGNIRERHEQSCPRPPEKMPLRQAWPVIEDLTDGLETAYRFFQADALPGMPGAQPQDRTNFRESGMRNRLSHRCDSACRNVRTERPLPARPAAPKHQGPIQVKLGDEPKPPSKEARAEVGKLLSEIRDELHLA